MYVLYYGNYSTWYPIEKMFHHTVAKPRWCRRISSRVSLPRLDVYVDSSIRDPLLPITITTTLHRIQFPSFLSSVEINFFKLDSHQLSFQNWPPAGLDLSSLAEDVHFHYTIIRLPEHEARPIDECLSLHLPLDPLWKHLEPT